MTDLFGNQKIRTLGLYQPFASMMAFGKIETRWVGKSKSGKWKKPPFKLGKYLIYSCKKAYHVSDGALDGISTHDQIDIIEDLQYQYAIFFTEFGSALMLTDLVRIIDPLTSDVENTYVRFQQPTDTHRMVGLVFENVQRIQPFEFKGKQGIGFLDDVYKSKIKFI